MCGVLAILTTHSDQRLDPTLRAQALDMARRLRHRGPDWSGLYADDRAILGHERLSIVDITHGAQPLVDRTTGAVLSINGEIYNHRELRRELMEPHDFQTDSDCEVLLYLHDEARPETWLDRINGIFAFVLWDPARGTWLIARDPIGVLPLYVGWDAADQLHVASELKALVPHCTRIQEVPPGHFWWSAEQDLGFQPYYRPRWAEAEATPEGALDLPALREALESAVQRQMMCDVPYGVLLSGGVDSSLIAALAARHAARRVESDERDPAWWPRLHSFSIGLEGAPDFGPARQVAEHIGSEHHEFTFTVQEGLDALSDVIYHLETFDLTTVRASTPMYLLMRKIHAMGIKMVLSGEGADEVFGGYLYFHKAPSGRDLHAESVRKVKALHRYDCLRANKSSMAWGVEVRVPFLDRAFLEVAMAVDPTFKVPRFAARPIEKCILRQAFDGLIPDAVLWRQKEQFSDGVGYRWIDGLKAHAETVVSDAMLREADSRFPEKTPDTKEGYLYRMFFEKHFPHPDALACVPFEKSVACSTPVALAWDAAFAAMTDPSGRAVRDVHAQAYKG